MDFVPSSISLLSMTVVSIAQTTANFKPELKLLKSTLDTINPIVTQIVRLNGVLGRSEQEYETIVAEIEEGQKLVVQCSKIKWNLCKKFTHSSKLKKFNKKLAKFFMTKTQADQSLDIKESLVKLNNLTETVNIIRESMCCGSHTARIADDRFFDEYVWIGYSPTLLGETAFRGNPSHSFHMPHFVVNDGGYDYLADGPARLGKTAFDNIPRNDLEIRGLPSHSFRMPRFVVYDGGYDYLADGRVLVLSCPTRLAKTAFVNIPRNDLEIRGNSGYVHDDVGSDTLAHHANHMTKGLTEGSSERLFVTQHGLPRELAIHWNSKLPVAQRTGLIINERREDKLPLIEQVQEPMQSGILSISTEGSSSSKIVQHESP